MQNSRLRPGILPAVRRNALYVHAQSLRVFIVEHGTLLFPQGEVLYVFHHVGGVLKGIIAAEENALQAQDPAGTLKGLGGHVAAGGDVNIAVEVGAEILLVFGLGVGQELQAVVHAAQQERQSLAEMAQHDLQVGQLVEQAAHDHAGQSGDRVHGEAQAGARHGEAAVVYPGGVGQLGVEVDDAGISGNKFIFSGISSNKLPSCLIRNKST